MFALEKSITVACISIVVLAICVPVAGAPPAITISVGPDEALTYPSNMPSLPDEHITVFSPAVGSSTYLFFAASSLRGGNSGTVALQTSDLKTFIAASGYPAQVMSSPYLLRSCDPVNNSGFDQNYAAAGSVVQDPTLPPGNLIMIYEAENHCPGGMEQYPYYATVGFMRSSDNGKTWPAPVIAPMGNADRYPVLKSPDPQPPAPNGTAMGNAIPSAIVDGNYLYVVYISQPNPPAVWDGKLRIARGLLGGRGPVTFTKWNNGSFSTPGIGGADSALLPTGAGDCKGSQDQASIYRYDPLGVFILIFVCRNQQTQTAAWYFSTASSLDAQDWSVPQLVEGSRSTLYVPCPIPGNDNGQQFDGWFVSLMTPGAASGHIGQVGFAFYGSGCNTDQRKFARRPFAVNVVGSNGPNLDQHGITGSWYEPATSGQGIEIEVFPDHVAQGVGALQGSWFTFDNAASGGAERGRWYTFGGAALAGNSAGVYTLYQNVGGNFDALPVTSGNTVGHATMVFNDCMNAKLNYVFTDGTERTGTVALTRLTPNVSCAQNGSTVPDGDFGLSGNWYDNTKSGQGFVFELNPIANVLFFGWYTYAVNGQSLGANGQRWYTGSANYTRGARSLPFTLRENIGGLFDSSLPTPTSTQVGTGTLTFKSCSAATLTFAFTSGSNVGQAGNMDLTRVGPIPASCVF